MSKFQLQPYQEELVDRTVETLRANGVAYLCLETRVGKTPVSIVAASKLERPILFCTKKSIIKDINATIELIRQSHDIPDIAVVSFDSLHRMLYKPNVVIIADEAHSFGTYPKPSKRATMLRRLSVNNPVIFLSATPSPESYSQIYHQLWSANATIFAQHKNFYDWARTYVKTVPVTITVNGELVTKRQFVQSYKAGRPVNDYSVALWDKIEPKIREIMIEFTQQAAGFKHTEIREDKYYVEMPEEIKSLILDIKKHGIALYNEHTIVAESAAATLSKVHQLCSGTVIPEDGQRGVVISRHKLKPLGIIGSLHHKLAIYYKFRAEHDLLVEYYGDKLTDDQILYETRDDLVFAKQFVSGREGINLKTADAIVFFNIDHAFLSYIQTVNRMQNLDREKKPIVVFILTKGGIEESILMLVKRKRNYTTTYFNKDFNRITKAWR